MENHHFNYVKDITKYERQETVEVKVGNVGVGGRNPIRIQSMTDTSTKDTDATVEQIISLAKVGADIVRCAVKGISDAENLKNIVNELQKRGYDLPLVADIHFNPRLAEISVKYFDKVRINPGNFYDKRATFEPKVYTDDEYKDE